MNKTLKVMTSAALLAGVVAPVAVTTVDAANTDNIVNKVIYVDDDYATPSNNAENYIVIKEKDIAFGNGDTFRLSLPSGVKWVKGAYTSDATLYLTSGTDTDVTDSVGSTEDYFEVVSVTDKDLELKINSYNGLDTQGEIKIPLFFEVDGAEGEVKVTVDPRGSTITGGQYTIATVGEGSTTTSIASVKTIKDGGEIDTIRIDENSLAALYDSSYTEDSPQEITLTLPSGFDWKVGAQGTHLKLGGGFNGTNLEVDDWGAKDNKLTIKFHFNGKPTKLGTIYLEKLAIDADKRADFGEIEVDLDGDEVTSGTLVVAKYGDFGTTAELEGDIPTLLAGRLTDDKKDVETVEVLIKETVAGSWLSNRSVDIEFPSWAKVIGYDISGVKNIDNADEVLENVNKEIEGDSNEISFDLPDIGDDNSKKEFKIKFYVSTKADAEGDLTVKVSGRAGIEIDETPIAKVISPVKVDGEKVDVRTGIKEQPLNDIVITEAVKGALLEDKVVRLKLSDGEFTNEEPKITVEEGNIRIDEDSIEVDDEFLTFEIDGESTRASKIKISGLALDLSRSVPEGNVQVEVGGDAIVQNSSIIQNTAAEIKEDSEALNVAYKLNTNDTVKIGKKEYVNATSDSDPEITPIDKTSTVDPGEFDRDYVTKFTVATVVTPADGNATVEPATFTIGSTTYKVGEVEKAMDVAPFVEAGRTYMPVRYVAEAVGVTTENILWDQATQTATFIKDARVAQVKVGSNVLVVNGANIAMDAAAKVVDGRTVIPVRFVAQALGANVDWNEADQTVTVK